MGRARGFLSLLCFILCNSYFIYGATAQYYKTIQVGRNSYAIYPSKDSPSAVVTARFDNAVNKTGWATLKVTTNSDFSDEQQAYAAGYIEGKVTRSLIGMHFENSVGRRYCEVDKQFCKNLKTWLGQHFTWIYQQIQKYDKLDPYWHQVKLFLMQFNGLEDGYQGKQSLPSYIVKDYFSFFLLQIGGDIEDLETVLSRKVKSRVFGSGSCSALIKDTWNVYQSMLRIMKEYDFNFKDVAGGSAIPGHYALFSSYPGVLYSGDDFYLLSSGLVAIETTIGNSNSALWKHVTPMSVLELTRNVVANRLARTGKEWCEIFKRHNSGTYNNEWMIVDYSLFVPGGALQPGLLHVLDQIPGLVRYRDATSVLASQRYWPSYNVASFPDVFNMSGGAAAVQQHGEWFSYDQTPRALIFKRDQHQIHDENAFIKLMRYNDFKHDPLAACKCSPLGASGENAISARSDLNPVDGSYPFAALGHRAHGGTDMKMTSWKLSRQGKMRAVCGPTHDVTKGIPPFQWSTSDYRHKLSHVGHPDRFVFPYVTFPVDEADLEDDLQTSRHQLL